MSIPRKRGVSISVIIPLYNGQKYIEQAVRSVWSQTLPATELIVVDDGSTDGSTDGLARPNGPVDIRLIAQENKGRAAARNRGVA
ncbi:MAG: glycosyltransferase family 2 protein, partial [Burkholderiales bacterium]